MNTKNIKYLSFALLLVAAHAAKGAPIIDLRPITQNPNPDLIDVRPAQPNSDLINVRPSQPNQDIINVRPAQPNQDVINVRPARPNVDVINVRPSSGFGIGEYEQNQIDANTLKRIDEAKKRAQDAAQAAKNAKMDEVNIALPLFENEAQFQQLFNLAQTLNSNVSKKTGLGLSSGDKTLATFGNQRIVVSNIANGNIGLSRLDRLQQLQPLELSNDAQYKLVLKVARELDKNVVERTGMGLSRGDLTLARFGNKRIVLQGFGS